MDIVDQEINKAVKEKDRLIERYTRLIDPSRIKIIETSDAITVTVDETPVVQFGHLNVEVDGQQIKVSQNYRVYN